MQFQVGDPTGADAVAVKLFDEDGPTVQDGLPDDLADAVAELVAERGLKADQGKPQAFVPVQDTWVVLVGAGEPADHGLHEARQVAAAAIRRVKSENVAELGFALGGPLPAETEARGVVEGVHYGAYDGDAYKDDPAGTSVETVTIGTDADVDATIADADRLGQARTWARGLVDEPPSRLTPRVFAERAVEMAKDVGLQATVFEEDDLEEMGCGGILGVASGSAEPPRMVVLEHDGAPGSDELLALAGKGVTFDSGGLSLKSSKGMETMKTDMGGAAAVLGAMRTIAELDLDVNVVGVTPMSENLPSEEPIKPGDVLDIYNDQTVEVLNTDAEGRLLLADALSWISAETDADRVVDAATLTGSIKVALGSDVAGVFGEPAEWRDRVLEATRSAGERGWTMPTPDDYLSNLDSDIADVQNVGGKWGGAIIAALFLREFVDGPDWAHLDIAGVGRQGETKPWTCKGGTGAGVATFVELARELA